MANVKLLFFGSEKSETEQNSIECFYNSNNEISFFTYDKNQIVSVIAMDRETAIKFSKELRKQIALIDLYE